MRLEGIGDSIEGKPVREQALPLHLTGREERHGLRKLVLVDHRAEDADLPPHHPEELEPARLVGQPGQDDAPTRPAQLDGLPDGRRGARGLDDQVDAFAAGQRPRRLDMIPRVGGSDSVGAERLGER